MPAKIWKMSAVAGSILVGITGCGGKDEVIGSAAPDETYMGLTVASTNTVGSAPINLSCNNANPDVLAWCDAGEGVYMLMGQTEPDGASSSSNSSSGNASSSSSGNTSSSTSSTSSSSGGPPSPLDFGFVHAPSKNWVEEAGWRFAPGSYDGARHGILSNVEGFSVMANGRSDYRLSSHTPLRGHIFELSFTVRAQSDALIALKMSDSVLVQTSPVTVEFLDILYDLSEATVAGGDVITISGRFEMWSSSGLAIYIGTDGSPLELLDGDLTLLGEGTLTGNPILDR